MVEKDKLIEMLAVIADWTTEMSIPKQENRRFFRCPICFRTWWYLGKEHHAGHCWIPKLNALLVEIMQEKYGG